MATADLNGANIRRVGQTIFIALPPEAWVPIEGGCSCEACQVIPGQPGTAWWDTLAVSAKAPKGGNDTTWTVHAPEIHTGHPLGTRTPDIGVSVRAKYMRLITGQV